METWYSIGVWLGLGVGLGILLAGLLKVYAPLIAAPAGLAAAWALEDWKHGLAAAVGGAVGGLAAAVIVSGALRRGGTRGGTALLVGTAGVAAAALALVPVLGYLEALGIAIAALRVRRRQPERYAGLRTLAK